MHFLRICIKTACPIRKSRYTYNGDGDFVFNEQKVIRPVVFKKKEEIFFSNARLIRFSVCTLVTTADNNIVQTNGTQKEYIQKLNVECKTGYKLSHNSDNSATSTTLACQDTGEFEAPPVCVKKGNYIKRLLAIRTVPCISLNIQCMVCTDGLAVHFTVTSIGFLKYKSSSF